MKQKIINVFTNKRFVNSKKIFDIDVFENETIFLHSKEAQELLPANIDCIENNETNLKRVVNRCNKADLVVLWSLDKTNQKVALALDKKIPIAWRFYGFELYSTIPEFLYTENTILLLDNPIKRFIKNLPVIKSLYSRIKENKNRQNNELLYKSIKRTNYFLGLFEEEHTFLKTTFRDLPTFVKLPRGMPTHNISHLENRNNRNKIIIGHNAFPFNNHIDILKKIKSSGTNDKYDFVLIMNYGGFKEYIERIKKFALQIPKALILENYLPKEEFVQFYSDVGAFVLNAYRQCGVGNISISFRNGVKVYMNKRNLVYDWLIKDGFFVYTIEDFVNDLKNDNLVLTEQEAIHNYNNLKILAERDSLTDFREKIIDIAKEKKS